MGAKIKGVGTDIRIEGVDRLHGCKHTIIPDRIEAVHILLRQLHRKEVVIDNVIPEHLESLLAKLREMGVAIEQHNDQLLIKPGEKLKSVDIKTLVYPGFQPIYNNLSLTINEVKGTSIVTIRFIQLDLNILMVRRMNAK